MNVVTVQAVLSEREAETTDNEASLICLMRGYIRPDDQFLWFKGNTLLSSAESERYTVIYEDGFGQVASRISILLISSPKVSDSGQYTCGVNGTSAFDNIELIVNGIG